VEVEGGWWMGKVEGKVDLVPASAIQSEAMHPGLFFVFRFRSLSSFSFSFSFFFFLSLPGGAAGGER
jgi:hypothetical protein